MSRPVVLLCRSLLVLIIGLAPAALAQDQARRQHLPKSLLAAFREVISEPTKSTVQIYCDGYRPALGAVVIGVCIFVPHLLR